MDGHYLLQMIVTSVRTMDGNRWVHVSLCQHTFLGRMDSRLYRIPDSWMDGDTFSLLEVGRIGLVLAKKVGGDACGCGAASVLDQDGHGLANLWLLDF